MTDANFAKETARTLSEKTVLPITLGLLMALVAGVWVLANFTSDVSSRLERLEGAVRDRWTYHMARDAWHEWRRLNPEGEMPDLDKIRRSFWPQK